MKTCRRCGAEKPLTEFHRHAKNGDGLQAYCKACSIASVRALHAANPAAHAAYNREWGKRNPDKKADIALKTRLGLPHGTYARMLAEQHGRCAICDTTEPGAGMTRFSVDHDAATGQVRGLLCGRCNFGIGHLDHDEKKLLSAVDYLRSYPKLPVLDTVDSILAPNN